MAELGGLSTWRHGAVLTAVAGSTALVAAGLIGSPQRDERFESKQVVVTPAGGDGLRIREVVDIDFGSEERRGYQRLIPNDFGAPVEVDRLRHRTRPTTSRSCQRATSRASAWATRR